jgi:tetratricopeptide (TPR) repeat protein
MTAEQESLGTFSAKQHHEAAVAAMRDGNMDAALDHLKRGIPLAQADFATNPSDETAQRASEMLLTDARSRDRLARGAKTEEDEKRFRTEALGLAHAAIDLAHQSGNDSISVLPLTFLGDLSSKYGDFHGAIASYKEALTYPLPEDHTPAYRYVIEGKLHKAEYTENEKTQTGSDPILAAEKALEDLQTFSGNPTPDPTTRTIWILGGQLDIAEAIGKKHDPKYRAKAYHYFGIAMYTLHEDERSENKLAHRRADALKVREVLEDDLEQEFAEAQALRNTGDEEKQRDCFAAYANVAQHARVLEDHIMEGHAIHQSGVAHAILKEFEHADVAYEQAQAIFVKAENTMLQAAVLRDRGALALKQKQYERAHQLLQTSKEFLKDGPEEHLGMTIIKDAEVYHAEGNENAARTHIADGITTLDRGGDTYFRSNGRTNAARVLIDMGSLDIAELYLAEAEDILHAVKTEHDEFASDRKRIERLRGEIVEKRKTIPSESQ